MPIVLKEILASVPSNPLAQLHLADIYEAGGRNLNIGNDSYLSDIDVAHTLGIFSQNDPEQGSVKAWGKKAHSLCGIEQKTRDRDKNTTDQPACQ